MLKQITTLVFIALALVFTFSGCSKPQGFEFRELRNLSISDLNFQRSTVSLELVYFNPNNFGLTLKQVSADVYVDKNYVGKYTLDTSLFIPKHSEFVLPSRMEVDMRNLFKNAISSLFAKEILLDVTGSVRAGKAGIYVNVPINYSGRHKVQLF